MGERKEQTRLTRRHAQRFQKCTALRTITPWVTAALGKGNTRGSDGVPASPSAVPPPPLLSSSPFPSFVPSRRFRSAASPPVLAFARPGFPRSPSQRHAFYTNVEIELTSDARERETRRRGGARPGSTAAGRAGGTPLPLFSPRSPPPDRALSALSSPRTLAHEARTDTEDLSLQRVVLPTTLQEHVRRRDGRERKAEEQKGQQKGAHRGRRSPASEPSALHALFRVIRIVWHSIRRVADARPLGKVAQHGGMRVLRTKLGRVRGGGKSPDRVARHGYVGAATSESFGRPQRAVGTFDHSRRELGRFEG